MALKRPVKTDKRRFWTPLRVVSTLIVMGLVAVFGISSCNSTEPPTTSTAPAAANRPVNTLPPNLLDAQLKSVNRESLKLSDYSGKVLLVNLWATWCGPCRLEIPELVKLHREFQKEGFEVVGLSTENPDTSAASVRDFVRNFDMSYAVGWATTDLEMTLMGQNGNIPQSFLIARDGRVLKRFVGFSPQNTPSALRQAVTDALKG